MRVATCVPKPMPDPKRKSTTLPSRLLCRRMESLRSFLKAVQTAAEAVIGQLSDEGTDDKVRRGWALVDQDRSVLSSHLRVESQIQCVLSKLTLIECLLGSISVR